MKQKLKERYVVESTTKYSMFKHMLGNREETKSRKRKICDSIEQVGLIPAPIVINEKCEVIDGQARLEACKELGLPVFYMRVNGLGLDDCVAMNKTSTAWNLDDYINSYAQQGNNNYQILSQLRKKHKGISLPALAWILSGDTTSGTSAIVKNGLFEVDLERIKDADAVMDGISEILDGITVPGRTAYLQVALAYCIKCQRIDNERLKSRFRNNYYKFLSYSSLSDWITAIEDVYNYRTRVDLQVPIHALWDMDVKEKKVENSRKNETEKR